MRILFTRFLMIFPLIKNRDDGYWSNLSVSIKRYCYNRGEVTALAVNRRRVLFVDKRQKGGLYDLQTRI